jgi:hypothetical protein
MYEYVSTFDKMTREQLVKLHNDYTELLDLYEREAVACDEVHRKFSKFEEDVTKKMPNDHVTSVAKSYMTHISLYMYSEEKHVDNLVAEYTYYCNVLFDKIKKMTVESEAV